MNSTKRILLVSKVIITAKKRITKYLKMDSTRDNTMREEDQQISENDQQDGVGT